MNMYWRFVVGSIRLRLRRLLLAFAALAVAAALATTLFSMYARIGSRISEEFASYGANLVIAPGGADVTVPLAAVEMARKLGAIAIPLLFTKSELRGSPVLLMGIDGRSASEFTQFWHVEGSRDGCLAGVAVARRFRLKPGSGAAIVGAPCRITGILSTGGAEDDEVVVPFSAAAAIAQAPGAASLIQVRVPPERLIAVRNELRDRLPGSDVRLVRAVAETESSVVLKTRVALFLLLALILVITAISVSSSFSELVMERSKEVGILKAIGAAERQIAALFVSESVLLALLSTAAGYAAGIVLAGWIASRIFAAPFEVHVDWNVMVMAVFVTVAVALAAAALAAGRIWRIQPAAILRGD